jgi:hypothetical protein
LLYKKIAPSLRYAVIGDGDDDDDNDDIIGKKCRRLNL